MSREHDWTGPTKVIRWVHCRVCGIIKRLDGKNSKECKGPVPILPRSDHQECGDAG